ncbi:hypothetical protein ACHMW7_19830 [Aminobacter sp. UC22_36]|uniref:hypothetical protein n=1 Tax=Aminobacter sp. UC22_36 TaxID=3374549 RepID=UPI003756B7C2
MTMSSLTETVSTTNSEIESSDALLNVTFSAGDFMLEELGIQFLGATEAQLGFIGYIAAVIGGFISWATEKADVELPRAPYFAFTAVLMVCVSALQFVWLLTIPAIAGGYVWVLVVSVLGGTVIFGYFLGKIGMARSRDINGKNGLMALAFIPLANLYMLFTPSKKPSNFKPIRILRGGVGVTFGFLMLFLTPVLNTVFEEASNNMVESSRPEAQQASVEFLLKSEGLEGTFALMAAEGKPPIPVDEITTLTKIEARGSQLFRTFTVTKEIEFTTQFQNDVTNSLCGFDVFGPLLKSGGIFNEVYVRPDGSIIGSVAISHRDCRI